MDFARRPPMPSYSREDGAFYEIEEYILTTLEMCNRMGITSRTAFGSTWPMPKEVKFESLNEVQVYVDVLRTRGWAKEAWPRHTKRIMVHANKTGDEDQGVYAGRAYHQNGNIYIPEHGSGRSRFMRELFVLHELAHYFGSTQGHGEVFVATLMKLIESQMDPMFAMFYRICISAGVDQL